MSAVCPILVDAFESKAVVAELTRRAMPFEIARLAAGDYLLPGNLLVERKDVRDLHLSIRTGRFWRQIGTLRAGGCASFLLVEGPDLDRGSLHPHAVRGACISVVELGIPVIRTQSVRDTVTWLHVLAQRSTRTPRERPVYAQRIRPPRQSAAEAVPAGVPGVSVVVARRLLERYGTVAAVVASDPVDWKSVRGVGEATVEKLRRALL